VVWGLALIAIAGAVWFSITYIFNLRPGLGLLLYRQLVMELSSTYPGRPSPHTLISCILIGLAIAVSPLKNKSAGRYIMLFNLSGMVLPWLAIFGYATLTNPFYAIPEHPETGMSPITALGFLALGAGIMGLRPKEGLMDLLTASTSCGQIVRLMLPAAATVPVLFGWLVIYGSTEGLFETPTGFALSWGIISLFFIGLVIWQGFSLNRRDLTIQQASQERERMLNELAEAAIQIRQNNADLKKQAAALEQSNLELRQFTYLTSHDLQGPLRGISGFVQLLQNQYQGQLDEQADEWISRTVASTRQMETLLRDVLTYSRIDARQVPFEPVDLNELFDDVVHSLNSSIIEVKATVTRGSLPVVAGDRLQLLQLLENLIGNGIKYHSAHPSCVHVFAEKEADRWLIGVRDNGLGIDAKHQARIFELFRRLHTQQDYPGTGIGLAICRRIVQRHGGDIWVQSEPDQGSTFYFTIPVKEGNYYESEDYRAQAS
jgi:signal transduction histidine kinase